MPETEEYLVSSGSIPGLPGNHGPGWYLIDYEERTIRPKPIEQGVSPTRPETPPESQPDANTGQSEAHTEESVAPADETTPLEVETTPVE